MEPFIATLVGLAVNLSSSAIFELMTDQARADGRTVLLRAITQAAAVHPSPAAARAALIAWTATQEFRTLLEQIRDCPQAFGVDQLTAAFRDSKSIYNAIAEQPHLRTLIEAFFRELDAAMLASPLGHQLLDQRLRTLDARQQQAIADLAAQLKVLNPTPFLNAEAFRTLLLRRDPLGYSLPYARKDWAAGATALHGDLRAFLARAAPRALLITAGGGQGKTRAALELATWLEGERLARVVLVEPGNAAYAQHLRELPSEPFVVMVDDAESADVRDLLTRLNNDPAVHPDHRVVVFARPTAELRVRTDLARAGVQDLVHASLPPFTMEDADVLFEALRIGNHAVREVIYRRTRGVPLFLVVAARELRREHDLSDLPAGHLLLERYWEEALDAYVSEGYTRREVKRVLATLALLRGAGEGTPVPVALLGTYARVDEPDARDMLRLGVNLGLLREESGLFRFAYDLVMEFVLAREVHVEDALTVLAGLSPLAEPAVYPRVLRSLAHREYLERGTFLNGVVQRWRAQLGALNASERLLFVRNVVDPLLGARPEDALNLLEVTLQQTEAATDSVQLEVVLRLQALAQLPALKPRLLGVAEQAGTAGLVQGEALQELVKAVVSPVPRAPEPYAYLDAALRILARWMTLGEPLAGVAITAFGAALSTEPHDLTDHPDEPFAMVSHQWRFPFTELSLQRTVVAAREVLTSLPSGVLRSYGAGLERSWHETVTFLGQGGELSDERECEARAWLDLLDRRAGDLRPDTLLELTRSVAWIRDYGAPALQAEAGRLTGVLFGRPDVTLERLFFQGIRYTDVPVTRDDPEGLHEHLQTISNLRVDLTRALPRTYPPEVLAGAVVRGAHGRVAQQAGLVITDLLEVDAPFAWTVFEHLAPEPVGVTAVAALPDLWRDDRTRTVAWTERHAGHTDPAFRQHLAQALVQLPQDDPAAAALTREALTSEHDDLRVTALRTLLFQEPDGDRFYRTLLDTLQDVARNAAVAPNVGEVLSLALQKYDVSSAVVRAILDAYAAEPLGPIDHHKLLVAQLFQRQLQADPMWLLTYLDARAERGLPAWRPSGVAQPTLLHEVSLNDPAGLPSVLDRLWVWSTRPGRDPGLARLGAAWLAALARPRGQAAHVSTFLRLQIAQVAPEDDLSKIMAVLTAQDTPERVELFELLLQRASQNGVPAAERVRLCKRLVSSFTAGVIIERRPGQAAPQYRALLDFAQHRAALASNRVQEGHAADHMVLDTWRMLADEITGAMQQDELEDAAERRARLDQ